MSHGLHMDPDESEFVEDDPTGRYGRYNKVLGRGATKTVYRGFDSYEGIEVAWNKVKTDARHLPSSERLELLYSEVHLLKTLKHKNLMKFYTAWVDTANESLNFVTEMFSSSLRQYRLRHKRLSIRALKHWFRQILRGILYLHSHDPPVIHRDIKCDNIFVNGNQGEVKIGDLGLAAIVLKSHVEEFVGTPEFIAPEVYEGEYNELVDVYSFGMCVLELVTCEYPYSECADPAEIYKKVTSGTKPDALYKLKDPELRQFVEKCLATVTLRLSAAELLNDPFLQIDDSKSDFRLLDHISIQVDIGLTPTRHPCHGNSNSHVNGHSNGDSRDAKIEQKQHQVEIESSLIKHSQILDQEQSTKVCAIIKGKMRDNGGIFLRLQVADKKGRVQKIYFPFNTKIDTALDVATEMVAEHESTDQDVTKIADMIDAEISSLVPEWRPVSAKYSPRLLQRSDNPHNETRSGAEPKPSEWNAVVHEKPQDSVTNNPFGCRPSVQSEEERITNQASSFIGSKPTIFSRSPLQHVAVREHASDHASSDSTNKPNTHLGVPSKTLNTNSQAVAPQASFRTRLFRRWK